MNFIDTEIMRDNADRIIQESTVAQRCMETEDVLFTAAQVLKWFREWDLGIARGIYGGRFDPEKAPVNEWRDLVAVMRRLQEVATLRASEFERDYDVRHIAEIRAIRLSDFAVVAFLDTIEGREVVDPAHVRLAIESLKAEAAARD